MAPRGGGPGARRSLSASGATARRCYPCGVPTIRGVIFDLDGTLVDSNDAHVLAWVEAIAELGWTVTQEQIGDTRHELEAARRAGVVAFAFRCGGAPEDSLVDAAEIYDGPAALLDRLARSLLA